VAALPTDARLPVATRSGRRDHPAVVVAHPGASLYGSDRMALEAVRGMLDAGLKVTLTTPRSGPLTDQVRAWGGDVAICPTPVLRKGLLSPVGLARLAADGPAAVLHGIALLRRMHADALYVSTVTIPLWVLLGRALRIPVICHVHEAERPGSRLLRQVLTLPAAAATGVIANSMFTRQVLAATAPALEAEATVVLNGVSAPAEVIPAPPLADGPLRVVYLGRISERKGAHVAVAAVRELVGRGLDVTLDLVGDVYADHAEFGAALGRQLEDEALRGRVVQHGFQSDVWPFLAAGHLLVVPSIETESFGNTAVEGVLAGRPVIASDIGGLPEALAGCTASRLVPPGEVGALADAIADVAAHYPLLSTAALTDAAAAAARFAPRRYRQQVAAVVTRLARPR
jgi:glycosyltransferase involved in cell wall biosynthesis